MVGFQIDHQSLLTDKRSETRHERFENLTEQERPKMLHFTSPSAHLKMQLVFCFNKKFKVLKRIDKMKSMLVTDIVDEFESPTSRHQHHYSR